MRRLVLAVAATAFALLASPASAQSISIVSITPNPLVVAPGETKSVDVQISRTNYSGSGKYVTLTITSTLPSGVTTTISSPGTISLAGAIQFTIPNNVALGSTNVTVRASGTGVSSVTSSFTLTIQNPPGIELSSITPSTKTIAPGNSDSVSVGITRTAFTGSVTLAVTAGLPSGVTTNITNPGTGNTGSVTFIVPADVQTGTFTVTIRASGSGVASSSLNFTLVISNPAGITLTSISPDPLTVAPGSSGSVTVTIARTAFTGSVSLAVTSTLPSGVTATPTNPGTGNSGSMAFSASGSTQLGSFTVTIRASGTNVASSSRQFTLIVSNPAAISISSIAPDPLTVPPGGSATTTVTLGRTGYTGSVSLAITSTLPSGVTAQFTHPASSNSGTVTVSAPANVQLGTFTVTVRASGTDVASVTRQFTLIIGYSGSVSITSVAPDPITIAPGSTGSVTVNISRTSYTGTVTLAIVDGLPSGVTASFTNPGSSNSGAVSLNVPANVQLGTFTVRVRASGTNVNSGERTFTLTISEPDLLAITAIAPDPLNVAAGSSGSIAVTISRSTYTGSVSLAVTAGLPALVSTAISHPGTGNGGQITFNVPADVQVGSFIVTVRASGTGVASASRQFTLNVAVTPVITISSIQPSPLLLQTGTQGSVTVALTRTAFTGAVTLSTPNGVPAGVSVTFVQPSTGNSGSITFNVAAGTPVGTYTVTVRATGSGVSPADRTFTLVLINEGSLTVTVQRPDGAAQAGAKVVRYTAIGLYLDTATADANGRVTYTNIPLPSSFVFEAYYERVNAFDTLGELWANAPVTVNTSTFALTLRRNYPYLTSIRVVRQSDGADVSGQTVPAGTPLRLSGVVRNGTAGALSTAVQFRADGSASAPFEFDSTAPAQSIPAGTERTFSADWLAPGVASPVSYSVAARVSVAPGGKSDATNWTPLITIVPAPDVREKWTTAVLRGQTYTFFVYRRAVDPSVTNRSLFHWGRTVLGMEVEPSGLSAIEAYRLALVAENRLVLSAELNRLTPDPRYWASSSTRECRTDDDASACTSARDVYCLLRATAADAARFSLVYYDGWTGTGGMDAPDVRRRIWKDVLLQAALGAQAMVDSPAITESREWADFLSLVEDAVNADPSKEPQFRLTLAKINVQRPIRHSEMMQLLGDAELGLNQKFVDDARKINERRFITQMRSTVGAGAGFDWAAEVVRAFVAQGKITAASYDRLDLIERSLAETSGVDPEVFCAIDEVRVSLQNLESHWWGFVSFVVGRGASTSLSDYLAANEELFANVATELVTDAVFNALKKHVKDLSKNALRFGGGAALGLSTTHSAINGSITAARSASIRLSLLDYLDDWLEQHALVSDYDIDSLNDLRAVILLTQDLAAAQSAQYLTMLKGDWYSIAVLNPVEALNWFRSFGSDMQSILTEFRESEAQWSGMQRDRVNAAYYFTSAEVDETLRRWLLGKASVAAGASTAGLSVSAPSAVRLGRSVTVTATVTNSGADTGTSYFDISTSNNITYLAVQPTDDLRRYDIGDPLYSKQGTQISATNRLHSFVWKSFPGASSRTYQITFTPGQTGQHWLKLRVSLGHSSASDGYSRYPASGDTDQQGWNVITVPVSVTQNQAPVIQSILPLASAVTISSAETFAVLATDAEADPLTVRWFLNDTLLADGSSVNVAAANYPPGTYPLDAVVSDGEAVAVRTWTVTIGAPCAPPAAPVLSAPATAAGPFTLAWTSCADCTFEVQDSSSSDFADATTTPSSTATLVVNRAVLNDTTRYYRVATVKSCGQTRVTSGWSNTAVVLLSGACATPPAPTLTAAATESVNGASYKLSWTPGADGTEFVLEESVGTGFEAIVEQTTTADEVILAHTVDAPTTYAYRVRARLTCPGGAVESPRSNVVTVVVKPGFELAISRTGLGSGHVTSTPAGIACGSTCSALFPAGATVTLQALGTNGSVFRGWSGGCNGTGACSVSMLTSVSVTAEFGPPLAAPANLIASASASTVSINWASIDGAAGYQLFRSFNNAPYSLIAQTATTAATDAGCPTMTTCLYRVRAVSASGSEGYFSNVDWATLLTFTEDPPILAFTPVRAAHLNELRTAVNLARAAAGLPPFAFTDGSLAGTRVRALHLQELRSALATARSAIGLPAMTFTHAASTGTLIRGIDITELRNGVK